MEKQRRNPFSGWGKGRAPEKAPERNAPPAEPETAGVQGEAPEREALFEELVAQFYELERQGLAPEGFDLESACRDPRFMELVMEINSRVPVYAAIRVYLAEKGSANAEADTRQRVLTQMQARKALPKPLRTGLAGAERIDYKNMSSAEFARLEQRYKKLAQSGVRVPL